MCREKTPDLCLDWNAVADDAAARGQALIPYRRRLKRMVALRLDRRLWGRVDPSDIIQDTYVQAVRRWKEYAANPSVPFYVWLRFLAAQRLHDEHRRHFGAQSRDVRRETRWSSGPVPEASSACLAAHLAGRLTTPSEAAMRTERRRRLEQALGQLSPLDREILALRHFDQRRGRGGAVAGQIGRQQTLRACPGSPRGDSPRNARGR